MKNALLILFLVPAVAIAQQTEPFKGAKKILISNEQLKSDNMKAVMQALIENDFRIDKKDEEYGTITTEPKQPKKVNYFIRYNFVISNQKILITGQAKNNMEYSLYGATIKGSEVDIASKGKKKPSVWDEFNKLNDFAKLFPGTITYQ